MAKPPVYERVAALFGDRVYDAVFTYGDTIYNPSGRSVPRAILKHEEVHVRVQLELGPDLWWERWLEDPAFRLEEEARGYAAQYRFLCFMRSDRRRRARELRRIASVLSGPHYGSICSVREAARLVESYAERGV